MTKHTGVLLHAQKLIRLMQYCSLNNASELCCYQGSTTLVEFTMVMSIVQSMVVRCRQRTIVVTMLLEQELIIVDEKSLLMVVNND